MSDHLDGISAAHTFNPAAPRGSSARHYSPYGVCASDIPSSLGYTGQRKDSITGCYPLGNGYRSYSPELMRFQSPDSMSPFGKGGINTYAYCTSDPINHIDPTGHYIDVAGMVLRGIGMLSSALTLAYNFLGPVPTTRVSLNAARISTLGSLLSLGSSAAQFAGVQSAVFGANVGTAISVVGTSVRAVYSAFGSGSQPIRQMKDNWKLLTSGPVPSAADRLDAASPDIVVMSWRAKETTTPHSVISQASGGARLRPPAAKVAKIRDSRSNSA
ncbi:RHS repeat-associated core domain-containing protein [Pseudomonas cremoricolorata]|uniref:RHS repeat-associated core domain-containing protein n=1 Tax=Pseudomonas cremoricolorata TaxID=157783 RepID=UPI0009DDA0B3|nr:RHS repeat-associated core domain-containing protein [Pseudomonas cremoricolorata]